jgi:ubiquinone/menaquinone biosynthesis C-methylase UbiE
MKEFSDKSLHLAEPTVLPSSPEEANAWQEANKSWWEENPMRYDWLDALGVKEFSREFYAEIDRRFFENAKSFGEKEGVPFARLLDREALKDKDVLEIGVGMGSHAQILASHAKSYTGIDLTRYASHATAERLRVFGLPGTVKQMDAERMEFPDGSFDYVWSWGVIHHSANTPQILKEIHRVLRPGGRAAIMVYYRSWWSYYVVGILRGLLTGNIWKTQSLSKSMQWYTDGALARFYSFAEWKKTVSPLFAVREIRAVGPNTDLLIVPAGAFKEFLKRLLPDAVTRFFTGTLRMGVFLCSVIEKK